MIVCIDGTFLKDYASTQPLRNRGTKVYNGLCSFTQSVWFVVCVLVVLLTMAMVQDDPEPAGPIDVDLCYRPILQSTRDLSDASLPGADFQNHPFQTTSDTNAAVPTRSQLVAWHFLRCLKDHPQLFSAADQKIGPSNGADALPFNLSDILAFFNFDGTAMVRSTVPAHNFPDFPQNIGKL